MNKKELTKMRGRLSQMNFRGKLSEEQLKEYDQIRFGHVANFNSREIEILKKLYEEVKPGSKLISHDLRLKQERPELEFVCQNDPRID